MNRVLCMEVGEATELLEDGEKSPRSPNTVAKESKQQAVTCRHYTAAIAAGILLGMCACAATIGTVVARLPSVKEAPSTNQWIKLHRLHMHEIRKVNERSLLLVQHKPPQKQEVPEEVRIGEKCSTAGLDCRTTQRCCGRGLQCFTKNKWYAGCMATCNPASGWGCEKLGERTPSLTDGSWAGEDCSLTRKCNNKELKCIRKDLMTAYCTETAPPDWNGELLGGSRVEYPIEKASPGMDTSKGGSLFCFMAILPNSVEEQLHDVAKERGASIYTCNASAIYYSARSVFVHIGSWNSFANTDAFVKIWQQVRQDGRWAYFDWTVKVDPDCVFMPYRLHYHLGELRAPKLRPVYVKNSEVSFGFLGAIEIVNSVATASLLANLEDCNKTMSNGQSGEDGFIKNCLDAVGVGFMQDPWILKKPFDPDPCQDPTRVAFHPRKTAGEWVTCYNTASAA